VPGSAAGAAREKNPPPKVYETSTAIIQPPRKPLKQHPQVLSGARAPGRVPAAPRHPGPAPSRPPWPARLPPAGLTCPSSPESALSGRPGQRGGRARYSGRSFFGRPPCETSPGARVRPGRAGSASGPLSKGFLKRVSCLPLLLPRHPQDARSQSGPWQLKHDFKRDMKRTEIKNFCVLEHLFPRAADIT